MSKPKTDENSLKPRQQFALAETVFTVEEAAAYLRISRAFLYRLIEGSALKPFKVGERTLIDGREIRRYVDARTAEGRQ
jgi:excisionase family DNA binding protein